MPVLAQPTGTGWTTQHRHAWSLSHFQLISSGVAHPTPDTVPARKSSIIQVPKKSLNYLITCYLLQGVAGQGHQVLFWFHFVIFVPLQCWCISEICYLISYWIWKQLSSLHSPGSGWGAWTASSQSCSGETPVIPLMCSPSQPSTIFNYLICCRIRSVALTKISLTATLCKLLFAVLYRTGRKTSRSINKKKDQVFIWYSHFWLLNYPIAHWI